jgi:hypothetical protein
MQGVKSNCSEFIRYALSIANEFAVSRPVSEKIRYDPDPPFCDDARGLFCRL